MHAEKKNYHLMPPLPTDPAIWTYATVVEAVQRYTWEPAILDFKEVLHPGLGSPGSKQQHNEHIRQTAVAYANSLGGHLIFGVKDPAKTKFSRPEDLVIGIPLAGDLRKELGDKFRGVLAPLDFDVAGVPLPGQPSTGTGVLIAHVPPSPQRPHMDPDGRFYRRDPKGTNEHMNLHEVQEQMLYGAERLRKIRLLQVLLRQLKSDVVKLRVILPRELKPEDLGVEPPTPIMLRFDASAIRSLVADVCGLLPAGDDILDTLIQIGTEADLSNRFLDRTLAQQMLWTPEAKNGVVQGAHANADDLYDHCRKAEAVLDRAFGALT